jgi:hypothetical protein
LVHIGLHFGKGQLADTLLLWLQGCLAHQSAQSPAQTGERVSSCHWGASFYELFLMSSFTVESLLCRSFTGYPLD